MDPSTLTEDVFPVGSYDFLDDELGAKKEPLPEHRRAAVRSLSVLVDRVGAWANTNYVYDPIQFIALPKKIDKAKIASKYRESNLSSAQIAESIGVSKQAVLGWLRSEGVFKAKGRGRAPENYRFQATTPFGKRVRDGKLVVNPREFKIARLIVELRDRKGLDWSQVCEQLNAKGYRTRRDTIWREYNARRIYKLWRSKL